MSELIDDGRSDLIQHDKNTASRAKLIISKGSENLENNLMKMAQELGIDMSKLKEEKDKDKQIDNDQKDVEIGE